MANEVVDRRGYEVIERKGREPIIAENIVIRRPGVMRPISWGALFGGTVISLAFQLLLAILAVGVGVLEATTATGGGGGDPASLGLAAGLWLGLVYLISLILGGFFAARLCGMASILDGILHGILTWAVVLAVMFYLATAATSGILGSFVGIVGKTVSAAGPMLKPIAAKVVNVSGVSPQNLKNQAQELLRHPNPAGLNPQQSEARVAIDLKNYLAGGPNAQNAKNDIIAIMSAQLGISQAQAATKFNQWQAQFEKTKTQAIQTAKSTGLQAAKTLSWAAIWTFVALAIGIIAGAIGGALGTRYYVEEATR
ncbi:MAG: hypothetical protein ACREP6_07880 [Candidatus Binataceae bacterium]